MLKKSKQWLIEHPIWSFLIICALLTFVTYVSVVYMNKQASEVGKLASIGDFLGGTIGNVVALAGSFVAIMIATNSYLINKKDLLREEILFLEEKISPACRKIVVLKNHVDKLIIAVKEEDELLTEKANIDDRKAESAREEIERVRTVISSKVREIIEITREIEDCSDAASTYALYLLQNNNKTKTWFECIKELDCMILVDEERKREKEFRNRITFINPILSKASISLFDDKTIYSVDLSTINLLKKINSFKVTETDIKDSVSKFVDLGSSHVLELIITNNIMGFDSEYVDISNTFNFKKIILKNSSYYADKVKNEVDFIEDSNLIDLKKEAEISLKVNDSKRYILQFYFELLNMDDKSREKLILSKIKKRVTENIKILMKEQSKP